MSLLPAIGSFQGDLPFDNLPPFIRSRALIGFRACDGIIGNNIVAPLTRQRMQFPMRTATATIYDSEGTSIALVKSAAAWSAHAWPSGSTRNELLLALSNEEAIRYVDLEDEELLLPVRAMSGYHEWLHEGNGPLWSITNDAASDAWLAAEVTDGVVSVRHHNGTDFVESTVSGIEIGQCCSMRWQFTDDGKVRCWNRRGTNSEQTGALSGALLPASAWGNGAGVKYRINEFGDDERGAQRIRNSFVFLNLANRTELEQLL